MRLICGLIEPRLKVRPAKRGIPLRLSQCGALADIFATDVVWVTLVFFLFRHETAYEITGDRIPTNDELTQRKRVILEDHITVDNHFVQKYHARRPSDGHVPVNGHRYQ